MYSVHVSKLMSLRYCLIIKSVLSEKIYCTRKLNNQIACSQQEAKNEPPLTFLYACSRKIVSIVLLMSFRIYCTVIFTNIYQIMYMYSR